MLYSKRPPIELSWCARNIGCFNMTKEEFTELMLVLFTSIELKKDIKKFVIKHNRQKKI